MTNDLQILFLSELSDVYSAENQILKALPRMIKAVQTAELRDALSQHLNETEQQVARLKQVFEAFGKPAKAHKCEGIAGIIDEAKNVLSDFKRTRSLDAGLVAEAQKVEHYEIASYGTLRTWAQTLGNQQAAQLLEQTLSEEKATDQKLTALAERIANPEATGELKAA